MTRFSYVFVINIYEMKRVFVLLLSVAPALVFAGDNIAISMQERGPEVPESMYGVFLKKSTTPVMAACMPNWCRTDPLRN